MLANAEGQVVKEHKLIDDQSKEIEGKDGLVLEWWQGHAGYAEMRRLSTGT